MQHTRSISPVDEDLQNLYNEVWASFTEESTEDGQYDQINQRSLSEAQYLPSSSRTYAGRNGSLSYGQATTPQDSRQLPSPKVRRLPPTPVSPSVNNPSPNMLAMPEPEHYTEHSPASYRPGRDSHSSTSSNDLLRRVTSNGRRLPIAPNGGTSPASSLPPTPQHPITQTSYDPTTSGYFNSVPRDSSYRSTNTLPQAPSNQYYQDYSSVNGASVDSYYYETGSSDYAANYSTPAPKATTSPQYVGRNDTVSTTQTSYFTEDSSQTYNDGYSTAPSSALSHKPSPPLPPLAPLPPDSYRQPQHLDDNYLYSDSTANLERHPSDMLRTLADYGPRDTAGVASRDSQAPEEEYWEDEDDEDESRFINHSLLSHMAVQLRDKISRADHTKGGVQYDEAFTGKDIVSTIQSQIQRELAINHGVSTSDRRAALQVARSLQSQLFFTEVEWDTTSVVQDNVEDVYKFLSDLMPVEDGVPEDLPTGVVTMLTRCYSPSCTEGVPCYSYVCPRKGTSFADMAPAHEEIQAAIPKAWEAKVGPEITRHLSETEIRRQKQEEQYVQDIDVVETHFIRPLRRANPPVVRDVDEFVEDVFSGLLDLRECNRRLIEVMYVRQREEGPVIRAIGDVMFDAAVEFRLPYPAYIGHHPIAEKRLKEEIDNNPEFKAFLENCTQQSARTGEAPHDLKYLLNRPVEHLQNLPGHLETILGATEQENADYDALETAIEAIKTLQAVAQLATFQSAMGRGPPGKWEWHDLVSADVIKSLTKGEAKRQAIIFELIKGEMAYVQDLESISNMYITPLRNSEPPIISRDRLEVFIQEVFHNFRELHEHHSELVKEFHRIQREQHPTIGSIIEPLTHAALQFRDAYLEYIPNYPIAAYRIDDEMNNNPAFKAFVEASDLFLGHSSLTFVV
ncbi:hypothetical protein H0H92_005555 [Tricholoma furcatifolium]|nr:hypothetical protein H0H92_005555 [Tricholoma furcatifolium]